MSGFSTIRRLALSILVICGLIFSGCDSTSSSGEDNNNPPSASFDSGNIAPGGTFSHTFDNEGTFEYYCELHSPDMQGQVTVSSTASSAEQDTVSMEGNSFLPQDLTVAPNTEVVWVNNADHDHTVISGNPTSGDDDGDDGGGGDDDRY